MHNSKKEVCCGCDETAPDGHRETFEAPRQGAGCLGAFIIDELDAERQWEAAFAGTQDQLAGMAEEAAREHEERRGLLGYRDFSQ